jgi:PilZ domain
MLAACISSRLRETTDRHDPERRSAPRYQADLLPPIRILVRPSFQPYRANVRDISLMGLGIICDRHLQPGAILAIQLQRRHAGVSGILSGTVVYCSPLQDGLWRCGCRLSRGLTDDELYSLLLVNTR